MRILSAIILLSYGVKVCACIDQLTNNYSLKISYEIRQEIKSLRDDIFKAVKPGAVLKHRDSLYNLIYLVGQGYEGTVYVAENNKGSRFFLKKFDKQNGQFFKENVSLFNQAQRKYKDIPLWIPQVDEKSKTMLWPYRNTVSLELYMDVAEKKSSWLSEDEASQLLIEDLNEKFGELLFITPPNVLVDLDTGEILISDPES